MGGMLEIMIPVIIVIAEIFHAILLLFYPIIFNFQNIYFL